VLAVTFAKATLKKLLSFSLTYKRAPPTSLTTPSSSSWQPASSHLSSGLVVALPLWAGRTACRGKPPASCFVLAATPRSRSRAPPLGFITSPLGAGHTTLLRAGHAARFRSRAEAPNASGGGSKSGDCSSSETVAGGG
jgi:hypothetical protein